MAAKGDMATNEFHLLDFPDEVLLKIFNNFDYIDFMDASRVCTRFEKIAQENSTFPNGLQRQYARKIFRSENKYP